MTAETVSADEVESARERMNELQNVDQLSWE